MEFLLYTKCNHLCVYFDLQQLACLHLFVLKHQSQLFLGFRERTIGGVHFAVAHGHCGRGLRRLQRVCMYQLAILRHLSSEVLIALHERPPVV